MKAETAPATAALPKRSAPVRSASDLRMTTVCISRLVPNWEAVIGAMLTMFICRAMCMGRGGGEEAWGACMHAARACIACMVHRQSAAAEAHEGTWAPRDDRAGQGAAGGISRRAHQQAAVQVHGVAGHWPALLQRVLDGYQRLHDAHLRSAS